MQRDDAELFAGKIFNKAALKRKRMGWGRRSALDDVFKEIAVMKLVDHPNILRLHEVLDDDETGNIYIVLDLMEHGSCEPQEHGLEFFPEERARRYFNDTLLGLEELHNQGIMHHDIKPENLLLSAEDRVKIGDLGIAQVAVPAEWDGDGITHTSDELRRAEICTSWSGTPAFLAPEVASGSESFDGAPVDVWALGVSLWRMLLGGLPFLSEVSEIELYDMIATQPVVLPETGPTISAAARELLTQILDKEPEKRLALAGLRTAAFVTADGAEPLPDPLHTARFEPTNDQIRAAVTRLRMGGLASALAHTHSAGQRAPHAHDPQVRRGRRRPPLLRRAGGTHRVQRRLAADRVVADGMGRVQRGVSTNVCKRRVSLGCVLTPMALCCRSGSGIFQGGIDRTNADRMLKFIEEELRHGTLHLVESIERAHADKDDDGKLSYIEVEQLIKEKG
eukprot:COSAG04_NODE_5403_length_1630_cov_1.102547_2_plen_450_part_01